MQLLGKLEKKFNLPGSEKHFITLRRWNRGEKDGWRERVINPSATTIREFRDYIFGISIVDFCLPSEDGTDITYASKQHELQTVFDAFDDELAVWLEDQIAGLNGWAAVTGEMEKKTSSVNTSIASSEDSPSNDSSNDTPG